MRGVRSLVAPMLLCALSRIASRDPSPGPVADPLLQAMRQELSRAMSSLQLEQMERPYFIEYALDDLETLDLAASFGMLLGSRHERSRPLRVDVRVGSYEQDSSEFLGRQSQPWGFASSLVLEDDVTALRHDLWYVTDAAYKRALEQIAQKRAALRNKVQTEQIPDFAQAEPQRFLGPVPTLALDVTKGEGVARRLSAIFREYPQIQESRVIVHALRGSRYLVNSEGTEIRQPLTLASLVASASTQAPDGMRLWHYVPLHAPDPARLAELKPRFDELVRLLETYALAKSVLARHPESRVGVLTVEDTIPMR